MNNKKLEISTLAAGCFWCIEAIFQRIKGVDHVQSGYTGGAVQNPSYEEVCEGTTGHAEAVQITFNPSIISYQELLEVFWKLHDPTTLNRQGADVGTQYRSAIFYHSDDQKKTAEELKDSLDKSGEFSSPIVTQITKFTKFFPAEEYHDNYYNQNRSQGYCRLVIDPKIQKLYKGFGDKVKEEMK